VAEVDRITGGGKVAVVYDGVGKDTFMKSLDCLARRGMMASFGNASGPVEPFDALLLARKGSLFLTRPTLYDYTLDPADLQQSARELFDVVSSGKVKIEIGQRFALRDAAEAHRALEGRKTSGSTVLTI
jgi:NADPH2:quinone reductase